MMPTTTPSSTPSSTTECGVSEFHKKKLLKETARNWDKFYLYHQEKFFKDRYWTNREFPELQADHDSAHTHLLELGCGVGNFLYPILTSNPHMHIHCCDFSPRAIDMVKQNTLYDPNRVHAFVNDITRDPLTDVIQRASLDIVTAIFVLSAIAPENTHKAIINIASVLKPGGVVLFRDYGVSDHAQQRFSTKHRIASNFYVRGDGTFSVFFTTEQLEQFFTQGGWFEKVNCEYVNTLTTNKKEGLEIQRVFVQAKFRRTDKPCGGLIDLPSS